MATFFSSADNITGSEAVCMSTKTWQTLSHTSWHVTYRLFRRQRTDTDKHEHGAWWLVICKTCFALFALLK